MKTRSRSRKATPDSKIAPTVKWPVLVVMSLSALPVTGTTAVTGSPTFTLSFSASVEPIAIAPSNGGAGGVDCDAFGACEDDDDRDARDGREDVTDGAF